MATSANFPGDVIVGGTLSAAAQTLSANSVTNATIISTAAIDRTKLAKNGLQSFPIDLGSLYVWDLPSSRLPAVSSSDDLGFYNGTYGTSCPVVRTYDVKTAGAQTMRARVMIPLPAEYDPGQLIQIRIACGMQTTIAGVSATIDCEAFKNAKTGSITGVDLVSTAAQSMNSLTFANKDFVVTEAGINPGDILDVRFTIATNDAASGTAVVAAIASIELLVDIRG